MKGDEIGHGLGNADQPDEAGEHLRPGRRRSSGIQVGGRGDLESQTILIVLVNKHGYPVALRRSLAPYLNASIVFPELRVAALEGEHDAPVAVDGHRHQGEDRRVDAQVLKKRSVEYPV